MRYLTQTEIQEIVSSKVAVSPSQRQLCQKIGVSDAQLSRAVNGGHIGGKILTWFGYRKVRTKYYEKVRTQK